MFAFELRFSPILEYSHRIRKSKRECSPVPERIFVAVAWPYANSPLHLGHIFGCYLSADIFARYHRMKGNDVLMVSGSDTQGTAFTVRAD